MEMYEKTSYLNAYQNHLEMKKYFGDKAKPPGFMNRLKSPPRSASKPKEMVQGDDAYKPRQTSTQAQTALCAIFSCEKCNMSFRSERQCNSHNKTCFASPDQLHHSSPSNDSEDLDDSSSNSASAAFRLERPLSFSSNSDNNKGDNLTEASNLGSTSQQDMFLSGSYQVNHGQISFSAGNHSSNVSSCDSTQQTSHREANPSNRLRSHPINQTRHQSSAQAGLERPGCSYIWSSAEMNRIPNQQQEQHLPTAPRPSQAQQHMEHQDIHPEQENFLSSQSSGFQFCRQNSATQHRQLQPTASQSQSQLRFPQLRQPLCTVTSQSTSQEGQMQRVPLQTLQLGTVQAREPPLPPMSDPEYSFFLNDHTRVRRLIKEGLESVQKYRYNVRAIITACRDGENIVGKLDRKELVFGAERGKIVHALFNHLLVSSGNNVSSISTTDRSAMAILFIATWPHMKKPLMTAEDRPWHHWYKAEENVGSLANVVISNQRLLKKTSGEGIRKKSGPTIKKPRKLLQSQDQGLQQEVDCDDPDENAEYLKNVSEANETTALPGEKLNILYLMRKTFKRRREVFKNKQVSGSAILTKFKHFISYGGEVILQEFSQLHPGKQNLFVREFPSNLMLKLLKLGKENETKFSKCFPVQSDLLNSLLVLAELLPTPRRTYEHERNMPLHANLFDLFHIVPRGTDPVHEARAKTASVLYPIQPYILAQGDKNSIVEMFLVIEDSKRLKLDERTSVKAAIDLKTRERAALKKSS